MPTVLQCITLTLAPNLTRPNPQWSDNVNPSLPPKTNKLQRRTVDCQTMDTSEFKHVRVWPCRTVDCPTIASSDCRIIVWPPNEPTLFFFFGGGGRCCLPHQFKQATMAATAWNIFTPCFLLYLLHHEHRPQQLPVWYSVTTSLVNDSDSGDTGPGERQERLRLEQLGDRRPKPRGHSRADANHH